jgi:hypothetical protein
VLLPYPLLILAVLFRWRLPAKGKPALRLLISTILSTLLLESGAWLDSFLKNASEPALLHPQLLPDLILSVGIYAAWWLTWWGVTRIYRFSTLQVFITTGIYGVFIEQLGKVFLAGLQNFPLGILMWLFVFVAYGSTMALAAWLARDEPLTGKDVWVKYPITLGILFGMTFLTSILWGLVVDGLNFLPPPKYPMREFPYW